MKLGSGQKAKLAYNTDEKEERGIKQRIGPILEASNRRLIFGFGLRKILFLMSSQNITLPYLIRNIEMLKKVPAEMNVDIRK